jgi:hypothetical protein
MPSRSLDAMTTTCQLIFPGDGISVHAIAWPVSGSAHVRDQQVRACYAAVHTARPTTTATTIAATAATVATATTIATARAPATTNDVLPLELLESLDEINGINRHFSRPRRGGRESPARCSTTRGRSC